MHRVLRQLTLNRIGAGLFMVGLALLVAGLVGAVAAWASDGATSVGLPGLSAGHALLLGLAGFVLAAFAFGLATTNERLARVEAKLDALAHAWEPQHQAEAELAEPAAAPDRRA
ncbi:MAG TPA: hypothetical protein VNK04_13575 [Gemmataceae bacterium]|jgi:hypothetical protein|nr:hypothetical protein [Gemmataceae bacterium]